MAAAVAEWGIGLVGQDAVQLNIEVVVMTFNGSALKHVELGEAVQVIAGGVFSINSLSGKMPHRNAFP